jgi:glycosyltransferase involved in cell wall biosynthesis
VDQAVEALTASHVPLPHLSESRRIPGSHRSLRLRARMLDIRPVRGRRLVLQKNSPRCQKGSDDRNDLGFHSAVVFLYAGNLHSFKGVADIVSAAALLPEDASFLCVFAGPEEPASREGATIEHFMRLARSSGVEHRVRFLGPVAPEKLAEIYCAADAVLLPTHKDCFPKVLVEAGLAGKPLVTTSACGSAGMIVQDGVNGFVIEPGDIGQLAQVMTKLFDPELRATMGARSIEIVNQYCRMDLEVQGYLQALRAARSTWECGRAPEFASVSS